MRKHLVFFIVYALFVCAIPGRALATLTFSTETVVSNHYYENGKSNALAIDSLGNLHVAYTNKYSGSNIRDVYYIKSTGGVWSTPQWVATMGGMDNSVSLAIDANNLPHIAYWSGALKYASYNGYAWSVTTANGSTGAEFPSLALDAAGNPHIAYQDLAVGPHEVRYTKYDGVSWSAPTTIDYATYNTAPSIALDAAGKPSIVYTGGTDATSPKIAAFDGVHWSTATIEEISGSAYLSIAIDGSGLSHVSYFNSADYVRYLKHGVFIATTTVAISTVEAAGNLASVNAIALDGDGYPHISYFDYSNSNLKYAFYDGVQWSTATLNAAGNVGEADSIALDGAGDVHVIYSTATPYYNEIDLLAAHWSDAGFSYPMAGNARGGVQRPTGFGPQSKTKTSITWRWMSHSSNELGFALYGAATSTGPFTLVAGTDTIPAGVTSFEETGLLPGTSYFRYVAAVNAGGAVCSSGAVVETNPLAQPVLVSPSDTAYVSTANPVMVWTAESAASRLQLAMDPGFAQIIADSTTANTFYVSTNTLSQTTYYWRVQEVGGPWASAFSFVVDIDSPVYSGPRVSTSPTASDSNWTDLPMATYLSTNVVSARITVQDFLSGLLVSTGLPTGLVGQWHLDESSGAAALDASTAALNGTLNASGVDRTAGVRGSALHFDGVNGSVQFASAVSTPVDHWTVEAWINPDNLSQHGWAVANGNEAGGSGYEFGIGDGNGAGAKLMGASGGYAYWDSGYTFPSAHTWYHVAMVGDTGTIRFYVNGVQTPNVLSEVVGTPASSLCIGNDSGGYGAFAGAVDEVRLYSVARSSAEVLSDYQSDTLAGQNRGQAYNVLYSTDAGGTWNFVSTSSVHLSGADGTKASQTLQADNIPLVTSAGSSVNRIAFVTSDFAGNISTAVYTVLVDTTQISEPPGEPVLSAVVVASTTIRWSWTMSGTATSFDFRYATGSLLTSLTGDTTFYMESNLSTGTFYSRYLVALNSGGQAQSSTVTVVTPSAQGSCSGSACSQVTGTDGSKVEIPPALRDDTVTWLLSENPTGHPLSDRAGVLIGLAQSAIPSGMSGSSTSITEFIVAVDNRRSTGTFNQAVTVSVPYPDANIDGIVDGTNPPVFADTLKLYVLNENTALWEEVPGSVVDLARRLVTGQIRHLSIFTSLGTTSQAYSNLSAVRIYPIPYRPNGSDPNRGRPYSSGDPDSGIIFDHIPEAVTIDIYSITGRRVARVESTASHGKLHWDVRNDSGQAVATGGYIATLSSPGCPGVTKKLLIIR